MRKSVAVFATGPTWCCKKTKSCIRNNGYTMVRVRVRFGYTRLGALATPISLLFAWKCPFCHLCST